ncbi:MAG: twin-arginine translocase TatA/TatE family subunit [Nitrospinaceae bacterium]|nr:twin-arginine translocase TatA/TatE family subunit [Nitrospinaceae bacterium]
MMGIGFPELMIILVIIMIIFGAGKLPEIGSAFGRSIKNFKTSMKEAEAEELETESETVATESAESAESSESSEGASEGQGTEAKKAPTKAAKKTAAAKKEEDLIDEAALEIKENRIGTIRTPHDGLVQQGDVFTTSLGRTPGGRGRDRGVSRDTF